MVFLDRLSTALWQPWLLGLFLCAGLYFSAGLGFFPQLGWRVWLRATLGSAGAGSGEGGIRPLEALSTALAATIGTGSIAGVSVALAFGGPGALFWLWLSALLGMGTSFVEKTLAVRYRRPDGQGGPMYYLRDGLHAPVLAGFFALGCILSALIGGNLVQCASMAETLEAFGLDRVVSALLLCGICALALRGGLRGVARLCSVLAPLMALLYVGAGLLVLSLRLPRLPQALQAVWTGALRPGALFGGGGLAALRYGVARGVFTNEAGLGTSAVAHAAAAVDHPARQGMWGILEVFISSLVVCTVTALVLLTSSPRVLGGVPGAGMTAEAFAESLGQAGRGIVSLSLLLFALSTLLGWSCYGAQGAAYLTRRTGFHTLYRAAYLLTILCGCLWRGPGVWQLVDLCNALLALPNLTALLLLFPEARALGLEFLSGQKDPPPPGRRGRGITWRS